MLFALFSWLFSRKRFLKQKFKKRSLLILLLQLMLIFLHSLDFLRFFLSVVLRTLFAFSATYIPMTLKFLSPAQSYLLQSRLAYFTSYWPPYASISMILKFSKCKRELIFPIYLFWRLPFCTPSHTESKNHFFL